MGRRRPTDCAPGGAALDPPWVRVWAVLSVVSGHSRLNVGAEDWRCPPRAGRAPAHRALFSLPELAVHGGRDPLLEFSPLPGGQSRSGHSLAAACPVRPCGGGISSWLLGGHGARSKTTAVCRRRQQQVARVAGQIRRVEVRCRDSRSLILVRLAFGRPIHSYVLLIPI